MAVPGSPPSRGRVVRPAAARRPWSSSPLGCCSNDKRSRPGHPGHGRVVHDEFFGQLGSGMWARLALGVVLHLVGARIADGGARAEGQGGVSSERSILYGPGLNRCRARGAASATSSRRTRP